MAGRKKLGLVFSNNENWIGGTYYILNLIKSLQLLPDNEKPEITLYVSKKEDYKQVEKLGYPGMTCELISSDRIQNPFVSSKLQKIGLGNLLSTSSKKAVVDYIFPASFGTFFKNVPNKIFWIPDFQEHYYPEFFSKRTEVLIKLNKRALANNADQIVLSSHAAHSDFQKIYPNSQVEVEVLNFAVFHADSWKALELSKLREKFGIGKKYFACPNQLWTHKNHLTLLNAMKSVPDVEVVFTGKEHDHRNPGHPDSLKQFVKDNGLEGRAHFLGFIARDEMLAIMKNSIAVFQPSLFEGWSTVVEDGKALNKKVVASDLQVHREQLGEAGTYIDTLNVASWEKALAKYWAEPTQDIDYDYAEKQRGFGRNFMQLLNSLTPA